jgi:hypothetical protein
MQRIQFMVGALIVLGCSGQKIDVGPGGGSSGDSAEMSGGGAASRGGTASAGGATQGGLSTLPASNCSVTTPLPTWPDPTSCVSSVASPLVGTWQGYVENAAAPWDQLTLVINGASVDGGVCGTIVVGAGPAPAPATDPNVGYPPSDTAGFEDQPAIVSGFALTLQNGTTDGARVRFSVAQTEPWRSWCELQPSYDNGAQQCSCIPPYSSLSGSTSNSGTCSIAVGSQKFTVNCGKAFLCQGMSPYCSCNDTGCEAATSTTLDFDLRFSGDTAEGSNTGSGFRTNFMRVTN